MLASDHRPAFFVAGPPGRPHSLASLVGLAVETGPGSIGNVVFGYRLLPWAAPLRGGGRSDRRERAEAGFGEAKYTPYSAVPFQGRGVAGYPRPSAAKKGIFEGSSRRCGNYIWRVRDEGHSPGMSGPKMQAGDLQERVIVQHRFRIL